MTTAMRLRDPITFEVFKNALRSIANEMSMVMVRTAHSPIASDCLDVSTALCDERGQMVAQGNGIMSHLGTLSVGAREVLSKYQGRI